MTDQMGVQELLALAKQEGDSSKPFIGDTETHITMAAKKATALLQKAVLANSSTLVERETLKSVIEENKQRFRGCLTLPLTLLFFFFYAGAATLHEDITVVNLVESPLRDKLTPTLDTVQSIPQVYDWINNEFIPLFFKQVDSYGDPLANPDDWSRIFEFNHLAGDVILELQRSVTEPCSDEYASHMVCYPSGKLTDEWQNIRPWDDPTWLPPADSNAADVRAYFSEVADEEGFVAGEADGDEDRRLRIQREELRNHMPKGGSDDFTFKFFLGRNDTTAKTLKRMRYLEERGWIDWSTTQIKIKALILNAELDIPRLENLRIWFRFSRGGGVFTSIRMESLFLRAWGSGMMSYMFDFLFVLMLVMSSLYITAELCLSIKMKTLRYHFDPVNIVTWFTVVIGWINVLGFMYSDILRADVNEKLEVLLDEGTAGRASAMDLHDSADQMVNFTIWYRVLVADAHILFMGRCFLALRYQPRLAVVTETLRAAAIDLFHFMIVLIPTFMAFAIAGNCMFGRRVEEFSTILSAVGTCFKIAMESEFDWQTLSEEDFWTTWTWVWTFLLLIVLLMLNMVLAIIMDVYSEVRIQAGNGETVWENIIFLGRRVLLSREWVNNKTLLERVSEMPRVISTEEIKAAIPELCDYQLDRLLQGCFTKAQAVMKIGIHDSYTAHMAAAIKLGLDEVGTDLQSLKEKGWMGKGLEAGSKVQRTFIQDILQSVAVQTHWMNLVQTQLDSLRLKTLGETPEASAPRPEVIGTDGIAFKEGPL